MNNQSISGCSNVSSQTLNRRQFVRRTLGVAVLVTGFPAIVPSSVFGANAPSKRIQIGQIGCGRIAHEMDMPGILKHDIARVVAVCDLDSKRMAHGQKFVTDHYEKKAHEKGVTVKTYADFRELLKDKSIDAVAISTPDHWHSEPVVAAALAGKDIYVQKPLSMTVREGRSVSDTVKAKNRIFQIGSQQRSSDHFRFACELVRNGRIGKIHTVQVGLPTDPGGDVEPDMPVPPNLNYEMWLGSTPLAPYTEKRVHPQADFGRPGWLRIDNYCLGMVTAWGSHHVDIAHWGMGTERTGPITIEGKAEYPKKGLWNVHGPYHVEAQYANGAKMVIDNKFPNGVRFEGSDGWIFVSRGGAKATASDPTSTEGKALAASDPKILESTIGPNEIHLHKSLDHHLNWLQAIQSRKPAVTNAEEAHRSTSACILAYIAMKLGRKLRWDPEKETFAGDDEANAMRSRPQRAPYGTEHWLKNV
jgi:myo-inositol 2-dehydrogenase/D-chiro-inositol 1-dehydrogenase